MTGTSGRHFMLEAVMLAEKGIGRVSPNPMVGAVVVKGGKVVGKGWHKDFGGKHAEVNALEKAGKKARDADLYVTLEPCNHYGKQPPCTKAIVEAGVRRVFAASPDPNKASGSGAKALRKAGVSTRIGLCRKQAEKQNEFYIKSVALGRPFTTIKIAMTSDGFITHGNGRAKKISGRKAFHYTQKLRERHDAILVGINTIVKDDPRLDVRQRGHATPIKIIMDPHAKTPLKARALAGQDTIVVCTRVAPETKMRRLAEKGTVVIVAESAGRKIKLVRLLCTLYSLGIGSIMVEGGAFTTSMFLEEKLFDRLVIIVSPKKFGKGLQAFKARRKTEVCTTEVKALGKDALIIAEKKEAQPK